MNFKTKTLAKTKAQEALKLEAIKKNLKRFEGAITTASGLKYIIEKKVLETLQKTQIQSVFFTLEVLSMEQSLMEM